MQVDGVPQRVVDRWFAEADWNNDGRIAGEEAKRFFRRTGLSAADLSKVDILPPGISLLPALISGLAA